MRKHTTTNMPGLFGSMIAAVCVGTSGSYNSACTHAVDAGTRQVGIRQDVDRAESIAMKIVNMQASKTLGRDAMSAISAGSYVYHVTKVKSINLRLPTLGLCNSLNGQIGLDAYKLVLEWKL